MPAPFPPVQVTLRDLKSISGFLWVFFFFLPGLLAEAFDCGGSGSEGGRRLTDAARDTEMLRRQGTCGPLLRSFEQLKRKAPWSVKGRNERAGTLVFAESGEQGVGRGADQLYECRAQVFFNSSTTALL